MFRRVLLVWSLMLGGLFGQTVVAQGKWPERPITLVVPYSAGGISDALARHVGHILEKDLGQSVVIDNKGGAGSNIGSNQVAKAAPDGYSILMASSANVVNMSLYRKMTYNTSRDFAPISLVAEVPTVLVVNAAFPAKTVAELIAMAKEKPDELAYASAGAGSPAHLAAELFKSRTGVRIRHVPYRGAGPAITDVMAGHIPMMFTNIAVVQGGIDGGFLRLLAVGSAKRWPTFPAAPTMTEAGVTDYEASAWYGLMVPAKTPAEIITRLQQAMEKVRTQESLAAISKLGTTPVISSADELRARIADELMSYAKLIKDIGLTID